MFNKILIANRGEIACRIARTAKRMGIATVAVYSEADRYAGHVAQCDEGFLIGAAAAEESYLCASRIIDAARKAGAEAIHPGYGFLSESSEFAEACAHHDIVFIGPPADAIRAMGSKSRAKEIMRAAGVPVVAGYHGEDQSLQTLQAAADESGYPLLIKAVCGGGGKGMRVVERSDEFATALASAKRESAASFGDERVLIEKYLPTARHVEVQIFADQHGHTIHLFERDCSIQRRHQKVIEEAPAPGLGERLRQEMAATAISAAQSIGYVGAGTVEFLLAADEQFYFMEMNTRLQVEHPVTEMITGQDLVEWQLLVAAGAPLPCGQQDVRIDGHAIEARIYAENPHNDFLPATGTLAVYRPPPECAELRIDSGVRQGDQILPWYDPMIAKLIVRGEDRESARRRLRDALAEFEIAGVATNLDFLHALTELDDFTNAVLDTELIARNRDALFADHGNPSEACLAIATLFELGMITDAAGQSPPPSTMQVKNSGDPCSPWAAPVPWLLNLPFEGSCRFAAGEGEIEYIVRVEQGRQLGLFEGEWLPVRLTPLDAAHFQFEWGAQVRTVTVDKVDDTIHINISGQRITLSPVDTRCADGAQVAGNERLVAPMPGTVIAVEVRENQRVTRGMALLTLEAMKMEHTISAPYDGIITRLFFHAGDQVREGDQLLTLEESEN